jgi:aryl-alcohol dehydrogenase-like predicted oxidoreductase
LSDPVVQPPARAAGTVDVGGTAVGRLGFGTMQLSGPGVWGAPADRDGALRVLRRAVDLGVDFFDTADSYGPAECELLVAEALHPYRDVLVATKGGLRRHGPGRWSKDGRPEHLRAACEQSLRRLRLDCIELYQLHAVDPAVPLEESLGALADLQAEGKIRRIGICNVTSGELERALSVVPVVSVQNRFSVADRSAADVLEACEARGIAFVAWAPLAKGYLTRPAGRLGRTAAASGATPGQLALAWVLGRSPVTIPIPGTASPVHLEENVGAAGLRLSADEIAALARPLPGYEARALARRMRVRAGRVRSAVRGLRT